MLSPIQTIEIFRKQSEPQAFAAGTVIYEQNTPANCMYGILSGEVTVLANGQEVETLKAGEVFGVGAMIRKSPRRHGAIAKTDCQLLSLDEDRFLFAVQETPMFALTVMAAYSDRLDMLIRAQQGHLATPNSL